MRIALVSMIVVAGCVPPSQQQGYYQQQPMYGQQPPAYGQQPPAYGQQAPAAAAGASCQDDLVCYGQCNPLTEACINACDQRSSPGAVQGAHTVVQCMATSGCQDENCVAQQCSTQLSTCTGANVATATAQPTGAAPAAGGGCEQPMQPEYYQGGTLKIPQLRCSLTQADIAGGWASGAGSGSSTSYVDTSGNYVGSSTVSTAAQWEIGADGAFSEHAKGATTYVGGGMTHYDQQNRGTFTVENGNTVKIYRGAANGNPAYTQYYIVYGWYVGQSGEVDMTLQGPFNTPPTQKDFDDAYSNSYRNESYHKVR